LPHLYPGYQEGGSSDDWAYGVAKFNFSYTIELSGRGHKFKMPEKHIHDVAEEMFDALKASALRIKQMLKT
jgi:hypothetical protein